jgi:hypothetical protein
MKRERQNQQLTDEVPTSEIAIQTSMSGFSQLKPVCARVNRPSWAKNEHQLFLHVAGKRFLRRWKIACMYWLENKSTYEIARKMRTTVGSIKSTIHKLKDS